MKGVGLKTAPPVKNTLNVQAAANVMPEPDLSPPTTT